jgi:hypothetical protein
LNQSFVREFSAFGNSRNHFGKYALHSAGAAIETESELIDVALQMFPRNAFALRSGFGL